MSVEPFSHYLSFEEFKASEEQLNRLEVWFLRLQSIKNSENVKADARNRVDLGYRSPAARERSLPDWDHPSWHRFEEGLCRIDPASTEKEWEAQAAALADELTKPGREDRWCREPGGDWPFGCIALEEPGTWDPDPQTVFFHIGNTLAPASLLKRPDYIRASLDRAARWALENWGPGLVFTTETWLNSHPLWLSSLPRDWTENLEAPNTDILWHLGFWGQFRTARGTFHHKNADVFRQTGRMPFEVRRSRLEAEAFLL